MPNITEVADRIIADDLPALFLDTCILLDVIRSVERKQKNCAAQARRVHDAATTAPRRCNLVVSHVVQQEWNDHNGNVLEKVEKHLLELQKQAEHFHDACDVFGIAPGFDRANYAGHNVAASLHGLAKNILERAIIVDSDDECSSRAVNRVISKIPPSKRGGEVKDCAILEEYLAVARYLREARFQRKLVFCTSNTNDYCEGRVLHSSLATEFVPISLDFASNLGWGLRDIIHSQQNSHG